MRTAPFAAALATLLLLAGCSGAEQAPEGPALPKGFDVPPGVTLTAPGTTLATGEPASVVLELDEGSASAVTVTVREVRKGSIKDFRFFSLDAASRTATPYYVDVSVRNEGPAGIGGVSLPVLAHSDANTVYPANELVGDFEPCPRSTLPSRFLQGSAAKLCLIYMLPRGEALRTIDLQPGEPADAVSWKP